MYDKANKQQKNITLNKQKKENISAPTDCIWDASWNINSPQSE